MYSVQELHLCLFSFSFSAIFTSSIVSVHSSTNLSINFFLHIQFSQSKYLPTSHDLSHSHSQLLGFQINPLSHTYLSINSVYSHLHISSFQRCLLLQTLASNLHFHLHVSCHFMCLVSSVFDIRLNALTFKFNNIRNTYFCTWIVDIVATTTAFTCFNTKRIKYRLITININNLWSYFTFLIVH